MGTTEKLATFFTNTKYSDLNDDVIRISKRHFLDLLAVSIAAFPEKGGRIITEFVQANGGTPESRLIGSGIKTSTTNAALVNGTLGHLLDFDDTAPSHPSACIIPVLLALGDKMKISGKDILTAQVLGYECFKRLNEAAMGYDPVLRTRGQHPTSLWGTVAAGVTAAKLLEQDVDKTRMTMGLAASHAGGLSQNFGSMTKGYHCGNLTRAGVISALLVEKGFTANKEILEGSHGFYNALIGKGNYELDVITKDLGKEWLLSSKGMNMKRYPSCGATQRAIEAAVTLAKNHSITPDQIESIEVRLNPTRRSVLRFDNPASGHEGKFSMTYAVAAGFVYKDITLDSYETDKVCSDTIKKVIDKIKLIVWDENTDSETMQRTPVKVKLSSGEEYTEDIINFRGHYLNPLSDEDLEQKFSSLAKRAGMNESNINACIDIMFDLENINDISQLMDNLIIR